MTRLVDWSWLGFRSWHSVFLNERRRGTPVDRPAICGVVAYSSEDACDTQISLIVPICFLLLELFMGAIHGIVSPSALLDIHFLGRTLFAFSSLQLRQTGFSRSRSLFYEPDSPRVRTMSRGRTKRKRKKQDILGKDWKREQKEKRKILDWYSAVQASSHGFLTLHYCLGSVFIVFRRISIPGLGKIKLGEMVLWRVCCRKFSRLIFGFCSLFFSTHTTCFCCTPR
ncbi:hypothetical protein C8Q69DRAFT_218986 [Paecilomyces variotii]|uniref:Uncharacterized protein n=1 Tax=Byssochlamys spectabilis TaxID=264951 RepID=A0A443HZI5_BYSSP|nr:hypothetical protein C8Q69DRAFT_218986 [Paecilomyces variotii]RWQ97174.1 hypothetical protein C8Q69DRAFT_218986 [Paecilomyces variotii]